MPLHFSSHSLQLDSNLQLRINGFSMGASAVQLAKRALVALPDAARYINRTYDVEGLHSSFPERLEKLRKRRGDRLTEH